jgi:hypothetical protein
VYVSAGAEGGGGAGEDDDLDFDARNDRNMQEFYQQFLEATQHQVESYIPG